MTQAELAERMGVTQGYVTQILNGWRGTVVGLEVVERFANALVDFAR